MTTISNAIARQDNSPAAQVRQYSQDFTSLLPSHIKPDTWVRLAAGALKKGKKNKETGLTDLEQAAQNDVAQFLLALKDAARLGLEPGTEQYYLTPRRNKQNGGRLEILGIVGYQGLVELMYRAGAVSSVIVEVVYTGDRFEYVPGRHDRPIHEIDWDAEDRGKLRLAYAYAVMKDGAVSKVVVLNRTDIERLKSSSQGTDTAYSPWNTNEPAMWMKSAARQLAKWVPTSAEYRREQLRAVAEVAAETQPQYQSTGAMQQIPDGVEPSTGEILDAELMEQDPRDES